MLSKYQGGAQSLRSWEAVLGITEIKIPRGLGSVFLRPSCCMYYMERGVNSISAGAQASLITVVWDINYERIIVNNS